LLLKFNKYLIVRNGDFVLDRFFSSPLIPLQRGNLKRYRLKKVYTSNLKPNFYVGKIQNSPFGGGRGEDIEKIEEEKAYYLEVIFNIRCIF
jgi:hypothetical protein